MVRRNTLVMLLGSLLFATIASAVPPPAIIFLDQWGTAGSANGAFIKPFDIGVDAVGDLYVSDTINHRIQKFDPNGVFILKWGSNGTANGQFRDPVGLTVDANAKVYVTEFTGDRVQKFENNGTFILKWGMEGSGNSQFRTADDAAVDPNGDIWIVDKNNHRIQKFTDTGTWIATFGDSGTGNGQFTFPVGIAIDSVGNIFTAEQGDPRGGPLLGGHRIQKFDSNFGFIRKWGKNGGDGTRGAADGEFNQPIHLSLDRSGNLFVPDSKNHRIQVFDNDGNFIVAWGDSGIADGQFREPEGVVVSLDNYIYVSDTRNNRIQKFKFGPAPSMCPDCVTPPASGSADFIAGNPRLIAGDTLAVPLIVNTGDMVLSSNMTVEYDSLCLEFVGAVLGSDMSSPGLDVSSAALDLVGATTAGQNKHVTTTLTEAFGNSCDIEVLVLKFRTLVGPVGSCKIVWDRSVPLGNPPNHLNTSIQEQIRFPNITFCDVDSFNLKSATFKIGPSSLVGGCVEVPLLVTTQQSVFFTNMTIEYHTECATFKRAFLGSSTSFPDSEVTMNTFALPGATNGSLNMHVTIGVAESYAQVTDYEILRLQFAFSGPTPPPCLLIWDRAAPAGNPPNHLLTTDALTIRPDVIEFLDGELNNICNAVDISGNVTYVGNGASILPLVPDGISEAVRVLDCNNTANNSLASNATYSLNFGAGPVAQIDICADRPKANCNLLEGGVLSGQDLLLLQDFVTTPPNIMTREFVAADITQDDMILGTDVMALRQWIAKAAVCGTASCAGLNCAGTWRFIYPTGPGAGDFQKGKRTLTNVCGSQVVNIEGLLLGDVDHSWPGIFPKAQMKPSRLQLDFEIVDWDNDIVSVAVSGDLGPGDALHHVIYSLNFDPDELEYLGQRLGAKASSWDALDNPANPGVTHGIVHRKSGQQPITESGAVMVFRFRLLSPEHETTLSFSRLRANDIDVSVASIVISNGGDSVAHLPARYSLSAYPNPFNPITRAEFSIPSSAGETRVVLQVYDIAGRLVRTLLNEQRNPGRHSATWNGLDNNSQPVGAGIYFLTIRAGEWTEIQKLALVK